MPTRVYNGGGLIFPGMFVFCAGAVFFSGPRDGAFSSASWFLGAALVIYLLLKLCRLQITAHSLIYRGPFTKKREIAFGDIRKAHYESGLGKGDSHGMARLVIWHRAMAKKPFLIIGLKPFSRVALKDLHTVIKPYLQGPHRHDASNP